MATNTVDAYEKILTANLQRTIDFLKFAEAKNAALLALASAWVVAIFNLTCSHKPMESMDKNLSRDTCGTINIK